MYAPKDSRDITQDSWEDFNWTKYIILYYLTVSMLLCAFQSFTVLFT